MESMPAVVDWNAELKGAAALIKSGLVPKDIRTAEAALFVILAGRDLGLSAVQSLRSIRPIQGKIEASADLQLGLFHRGGGKSRWLKLDATGAELELHAPWLAQPHVSKFGIEEAKRAELLSNANYRKYPQAMYRSRAITAGLKDIGFLMGAGVYAPGEIGGSVVVDESGEVLPGEQESAAPMREITSTAGTVEALTDEAREQALLSAQLISTAVKDGLLRDAHATYTSLSMDDRIAVYALLDKPTRKAIRGEDDRIKQESLRAMSDKPDAVLGADPDIHDVREHIRNGDFDTAADVARGIPDAVLRTAAEEEIEIALRAKAPA